MDTDKIVVYQTFSDPIDANIVKGLFDTHGIKCYHSDENIVTLNPLYSNAVGGIKLNIFEADIDQVSALLNSENNFTVQVESPETEKGKMICPRCHSDNVSYGGSIKRKFGYFDIFIPILLMIYPFTMRRRYHCFDCNHEFKKSSF